ncbi:hypothetical protein PAPYR_7622 [Paratrimastix pyriformis]|uniref:Uncharacterized protein n=1 Tax=Paratrimastix pyriformis TaxID=342808 RepID=A0ABQ8UDX6_9EUKA|nr:hypothetical protein PAPYR_7622 [Paratrimastix pyriformis]
MLMRRMLVPALMEVSGPPRHKPLFKFLSTRLFLNRSVAFLLFAFWVGLGWVANFGTRSAGQEAQSEISTKKMQSGSGDGLPPAGTGKTIKPGTDGSAPPPQRLMGLSGAYQPITKKGKGFYGPIVANRRLATIRHPDVRAVMRTLPRNFAQLPLVNETTLSVGFEPGALEQLQEWARGAGASVENVRASAGEKKLFISNDMATPMEVLREWQRTEVVLSNVALIPVRNRLFLEVRGAVDDRVLDPVTIIDGQRRVELRWRQLDGEVPKDDLGWASGRSDLELLRARQFAVDTGKLSADAALDFHDGYVVADPKDLVGLKSLSIDCHWDLQFFCSGAPYAGKDTEIYFISRGIGRVFAGGANPPPLATEAARTGVFSLPEAQMTRTGSPRTAGSPTRKRTAEHPLSRKATTPRKEPESEMGRMLMMMPAGGQAASRSATVQGTQEVLETQGFLRGHRKPTARTLCCTRCSHNRSIKHLTHATQAIP